MQAGRGCRGYEAEHREFLKAALKRPRRRSVGDVLASMPDVGEDADFDVRQDQGTRVSATCVTKQA